MPAQRRGRGGELGGQHLTHRRCGERNRSGEQQVEHRAGGVNVTGRTHRFASCALRADERRCAVDVRRPGGGTHPEVDQFRRTGLVGDHVRRCDVAVDDAPLVRIGQAEQSPAQDTETLLAAQRTVDSEQSLDSYPVDPFLGDPGPARFLDEVVHRDDARMIELRQHPRLGPKPRQRTWRIAQLRV